MKSRKPLIGSRTILMTVAACSVVLATSTAAVAAENTAAPVAEKRLVYLPHKYGYPFNLKEETRETAEFARVETAPNARAVRRGPPMKTGNPFPHID